MIVGCSVLKGHSLCPSPSLGRKKAREECKSWNTETRAVRYCPVAMTKLHSHDNTVAVAPGREVRETGPVNMQSRGLWGMCRTVPPCYETLIDSGEATDIASGVYSLMNSRYYSE